MPGIVTEEQGDCRVVRLSNGPQNLLTIGVIEELDEIVRASENATRGLMLCGGEKFFCNGLDMAWALSLNEKQLRTMFRALGSVVLRLLELQIPTVGVIRGHAMGAGKTLFSACDYRYAATGRVLLGVPEINLGVSNPLFADQLLRFLLGDYHASDLILSGDLVPAEKLVSRGLVRVAAEKDKVEALALRRLSVLSEIPSAAFAETKRMRTENLCHRIRSGMASQIDTQVSIFLSEETQQRVRSAVQRLNQ